MEKFKLIFFCGRPRKQGAEVGTAMLIGGGLSALGGVTSGLIGASSARDNNDMTMAYNKEMQQRAFNYQKEMYERQLQDQEKLYNQYQSPEAIARQLQSIGINTSAIAGKGMTANGMPSVPSPGSAPTASISALENPGTYLGQALDSTTKAIANLAQAGLSDAQANATREKLDNEIELLIAQTNGQDLLNAYQQTTNLIQSELGHDKAGAELQELHSRIFANYCQGHLDEANKLCQEALTELYQQQYKMNDQKFGLIMSNLYSEWQLTQAKIKTEGTLQGLNRASAKNQLSSAAMSDVQKVGQEFHNAILKVDSENTQALAFEKLDLLRSEILKAIGSNYRDKAKAEVELAKLRERIIHYQKYPNAASFDDFWDNFPIVGGIVRALSH